MKLHRLLTLFVLLACLVVFSPVFAASILPPPSLDPCFGADIVADMGNISVYDSVSSPTGTGFFSAVFAYDLSQSGTPVAHVITDYRRVGSGSSANATMSDTFIDVVDSITVFGRSTNRNGILNFGVQGVIVGAVNFNGSPNYKIKGSYLTTSWGGSDRFCAFLQ